MRGIGTDEARQGAEVRSDSTFGSNRAAPISDFIRTKYWQLTEILLGAVVAAIVVSYYFTTTADVGNYGLGDRTVSYQAVDGPYLTHIIKNNDQEENSLLAGWNKRGRRSVCLILGYSQAHSINEMKTGDVTYTQILFDRHKVRLPPVDVLCQSLPNANMTEYFVLSAYWQTKLPLKALIVPASLDKMRNDELRAEYLENLGLQAFQIAAPQDNLTQTLNRMLAAFPKKRVDSDNPSADTDYAGLKETVQDKAERFLDRWLNLHVTPWSHRADVRGRIFEWLYRLRNSVLGISSNSKRKVIPARYARNMEALEGLLRMAQQNRVRVLVYIPPIRSDLPTPYDDGEYALFKRDVEALVNRYPSIGQYLNIENIVPGRYWGDLPPTDLSGKRQPDFMHFKYEGHKLTADALDQKIPQLVQE